MAESCTELLNLQFVYSVWNWKQKQISLRADTGPVDFHAWTAAIQVAHHLYGNAVSDLDCLLPRWSAQSVAWYSWVWCEMPVYSLPKVYDIGSTSKSASAQILVLSTVALGLLVCSNTSLPYAWFIIPKTTRSPAQGVRRSWHNAHPFNTCLNTAESDVKYLCLQSRTVRATLNQHQRICCSCRSHAWIAAMWVCRVHGS